MISSTLGRPLTRASYEFVQTKTEEASVTEQELREQVARGCRILAATGHDDFVWGHVSARDPQGRGIWMKASTFGFDEITAEHVILVGFDGEVLIGEYPR